MAERHPMSIQQRRILKQDLAELREKLAEVVSLIRACYGKKRNPSSELKKLPLRCNDWNGCSNARRQ